MSTVDANSNVFMRVSLSFPALIQAFRIPNAEYCGNAGSGRKFQRNVPVAALDLSTE
jgi:hypothetical protein